MVDRSTELIESTGRQSRQSRLVDRVDRVDRVERLTESTESTESTGRQGRQGRQVDRGLFCVNTSNRGNSEAHSKNPFVVVTGSSGSGKSSIVHHIALQLQKQGYDLMIGKNASDIYVSTRTINTLYLFDDPFGKNAIDQMAIIEWDRNLENIKNVLNIGSLFRKKIKPSMSHRTVLLISCRPEIYKHPMLHPLLQSLETKDCFLGSDTLCLTQIEKKRIFEKYISTVQYEKVASDSDYFPLSCRLAFEQPPGTVLKIFEDPPNHIREALMHMKTHDKFQFSCICICVLYENGFNRLMLKDTSMDESDHFREICSFRAIIQLKQTE